MEKSAINNVRMDYLHLKVKINIFWNFFFTPQVSFLGVAQFNFMEIYVFRKSYNSWMFFDTYNSDINFDKKNTFAPFISET